MGEFCPRCGTYTTNLRKHLARKRCLQQHVHTSPFGTTERRKR
jgi:hypothetical protein